MAVYTFLGFMSILLWASNAAFSRIVSEQLGGIITCGLVMSISGVLLLAVYAMRGHGIRQILTLPKSYLWLCGLLFFLCQVGFYGALQLCDNRLQVLIVSALNYLWPVLTVIFSIPILHRKARPLPFALGILLTIVGTFGTSLDVNELSAGAVFSPKALVAYALALLAAVSWGLYSALVTKFLANRPDDTNALPIFMLICGILMLIAGRILTPDVSMTREVLPSLAYTVLFPGMIAYLFWDLGIQKGKALLVTFVSFFTIVLSTLFSSIVLKLGISPLTLLFCTLTALGAIVCKNSISE